MKNNKLTNENIAALCQSLGMTVHAGVSLGDGLSLLAEDEKDKKLASLYAELGARMDSGAELSAAMTQTQVFPAYVCGLIGAGERTGRLEETLAGLSSYYRRRQQLEDTVRSAVTYPLVVLAVMVLVIVVLLTKVMPVFEEVYAGLGGEFTGIAGGLLALGRWLTKAAPWLLSAAAVLCAAAAVCAAVPSLRRAVTALFHRLFGNSGIQRKLSAGRFAQTMAMGMQSGISLEECLTLAAGILEGTPAADRCRDCQERLQRGESLDAALRESGVLPLSECRLLTLALRGGSGDAVMEDIAQRLSHEADRAVEQTVSAIEPALVVTCAVLVGAILLAVLLPLANIMAAIG